jgi:hypothetical protein
VAAAPAPAPAPRTTPGFPPEAVRTEFWNLLDRGKVDAADARITPLLAQHPEAAWPHLARAEILFLRLWRRDSAREWTLALERDRQLVEGEHFGLRLCRMLDEKWRAAGAEQLLERLGRKAVPLLRKCAATAETPALRAQANRALEGRSKPSR